MTAANNQRQLAAENKKPYNFLPLHVNTNKSRDLLGPSSSAPATPAISQEMKRQSSRLSTPLVPMKDAPCLTRGVNDRGTRAKRESARGDQKIDSSQVKMYIIRISFVLDFWTEAVQMYTIVISVFLRGLIVLQYNTQ